MFCIIIIAVVVVLIVDYEYSEPVSLKQEKFQIARILCRGINSRRKYAYENIRDCRVAYELSNNSYCETGCLGLLSCVSICPKNAISKNLTVDILKCTGCGICVEICPLNLIILADKNRKVFVRCGLPVDPKDPKNICSEGCIKCYVCLSVCSQRAISICDNGLPVIDYSKCNNCFKCVLKCPNGVIDKYENIA